MGKLDVYVLQSVPSSNINRDDTGSPKTAFYGGELRARVSSQAWKRAMRQLFPSLLDDSKLGIRTKFAVSLIAERVESQRPDLAEVAQEYAKAVLGAAGVKVKETDRKGSDEGSLATDYLVFIGRQELDKLANLAIGWSDQGVELAKVDRQMKKDVAEVFHGAQAVDIALFGRMLADAPDLNTDASAQVAHAISVDKIVQEYDYFTAVDDCAADDNAGAGMLGTVGYNSSTLYRYATLDLDSLAAQLGDAQAAAEGAAAFVEAFVRSMPTGKQNTFANRTLPNIVSVAFRSGQPINPVSAFERPVRPTEEKSITQQAAVRLANELKNIEEAYCMPAEKAWCVRVGDYGDADLEVLGERVNLDELVRNVRDETLGTLASKEE